MAGLNPKNFPFTALERRLIEALFELCDVVGMDKELQFPKGKKCRTPLGRAYRNAMDAIEPCVDKEGNLK